MERNIRAMGGYCTALGIGINSGLLFALLSGTITAFLHEHTVSYALLGLFSLRTLPYSLKFLWSPLLDSYKIKLFPHNFGQRKSWLISVQMLLIISISALGFIDCSTHLLLFFSLCIFISVLAATHDIAMEAYRIELLDEMQKEFGSSLTVLGFRIGLITSGVLGLWLPDIVGWRLTFLAVALTIVPGIFIVLFSKDDNVLPTRTQPISWLQMLRMNVLAPFVEFIKIDHVCLVLMVVAFYKASDGYLDTMLLPFLLDNGFSKAEIAGVIKTIGVIATICGTFTGAWAVKLMSSTRLLVIAEFMAAVTNLLFIMIYYYPGHIIILSCINSLESFFYGISNIALIIFMSSLCDDKRFTATHFALLVSWSSLIRTIMGSTSGYVLAHSGSVNFFLISSLLSVPSLICLCLLGRKKAPWKNSPRSNVTQLL